VTATGSRVSAPASSPGVLCVCRDPGMASLLEGCVPGGRVYRAAAEAVLAATRSPPQAVVLWVDGAAPEVSEVAWAFRRAWPEVSIDAVIAAEDEPQACRLLGPPFGRYFVLPRDLDRLARRLSGEAEEAEVRPTEPSAAAALAKRALEASAALAAMAAWQPVPLFADGCRVILEALGGRQGVALWWAEEESRLEVAMTLGGENGWWDRQAEAVRSAAGRCLRAGETVLVPPGTLGGPPEGVLAVPVRDEWGTVGILCLPVRGTGGGAPMSEVRKAVETLAGVLARLYRAALRREELAHQALRDAETGLLRAEAFSVYLESQMAQAADQGRELALVLLEPEATPSARAAEGPSRLGVTLKAALARGWEAGRLAPARYGVVLPAGSTGGADPCEAVLRRLEAARGGGASAGRLQVAVARFPQDGATAPDLLEAAASRWRPAGGDEA